MKKLKARFISINSSWQVPKLGLGEGDRCNSMRENGEIKTIVLPSLGTKFSRKSQNADKIKPKLN